MPYAVPLKTTASEQHIKFPESSPESPKLLHTSTDRMNLSRSYSSTEYVRRHRRSPSLSKTFAIPAFEGSPKFNHALNTNAAVRPPCLPLSNATLRHGAVLSPPDSNTDSGDEGQCYRPHGAIKLEYLEAAVRSIEQKRESFSKKFEEPHYNVADSVSSNMKQETTASSFSSLPLSREGRKVSHSRSATVSPIVQKQEEAVMSSSEDSDRDNAPKSRPPMVRKKSGELVRPALRPPTARRRPSSMPGTPTYAKAVHFDSQLEHIRHFVQLDKPLAVSAETSPVDDHDSLDEFPFERHEPNFSWELRLTNFPDQVSPRLRKKVQLERLSLSSDNTTLVGHVAVANLAYNKQVAARFTFDYWKTISEVMAEYNDDIRRKHVYDGYDRFSFSIKLDDQANLEKKTLFACIRYTVNGQELWDNNNSMNYQADFVRVTKPKANNQSSPTSGGRPALPRSRSSTSSSGRSLSMPPSIDDFSELVHRQNLPASKKSNGDVNRDIDEMGNGPPVPRGRQARQAFGNRYDFEASLSAAMRAKPTHDRTTLTAQAKNGKRFAKSEEEAPERRERGFVVDKAVPISQLSRQVAQSEHYKPSSLINDKLHQDSLVYKELVDKYCFYGSPSTHSLKHMASEAETMNGPEGSSPDVSPSLSPVLPPRRDSSLRSDSHESRSSSASRGGHSNHVASSSPIPLVYPYHQSLQNNFLKESHTPAVIRG